MNDETNMVSLEQEAGYGSGEETTVSSSSNLDVDVSSTSALPTDIPVVLPDSPLQRDPLELRGKLGVAPLAVIIFYCVSGGPFGVEETVRSAGSFYTLLGFLVMPFIWSVQEALMTAELGSAFPESAGSVAWAQEAFGDRVGWMTGYLSWVSGSTDNAIYPVLFVDYLLQLFGRTTDSFDLLTRMVVFAAISCGLAYTNWLGLPLVGKTSIIICFIALSPFIILSIMGLPQLNTSRWFTPPTTEGDVPVELFSWAALSAISWRPYLNNLFWNLNSFDSSSAFCADVDDPGRVLPRALLFSVVMVGAGYFLPLLVALGASSAKQDDWVDGYFSVVAREIAGPWLSAWLVFAAGISNIAMFQAELSSDAFQLMGMAERGYLPQIFATRSRHGTPTYGLALGTLVIVCMTVTDLDQLIEMLNFNYAISLVIEYFAFLKLRISRPNLKRPYRIPLSTTGCFVVFTPTLIAVFVILFLGSAETILFSIVVNIFGLILFSFRQNEVRHNYSHVDEEAEIGVLGSDDEERAIT